MKPEIVQVHLSLQGFYQTLGQSVTDPVTVPSGSPLAQFSRMYYDCTDNEDEGYTIMRRRIGRFEGTIFSFISEHQTMLDALIGIEEHANTGNTAAVRHDISRFVDLYESHLDGIARVRKEDSFLDFPNAAICALSGRYLRNAYFNPKRTERGARKEGYLLREALADISPHEIIQFSGICPTRAPTASLSIPDDKNMMDTSYQGRINFTKEMLRRVNNPV